MARAPQQMQQREEVPSAGGEPRLFNITRWGGINTKADRTAIGDEEFSWLENMMPIGDGNLRAMFTQATPILTASGKTIVMFEPFNLGSTQTFTGTNQFIAVVYSDGTADQVDLSGTKTVITSGANTLYTSAMGTVLPAISQWGNQGILIVTTASANGYFAWDGSSFFSPGNIAPGWLTGTTVITTTGASHTTTTIDAIASTAAFAPGNFVTGPGIPANDFIVTVNVNSIVLNQATTSSVTGITIAVQSNPSPTGSTHGTTTVDTLTSTTGIIPGMSVFATQDIPANTTVVTVTPPSTITISNAATGTHAGVQFAFGWAMPTGVQGTAIEIFQSRVIIDNANTKSISAPANGATFATSQGGIILTANDSFLRHAFEVSRQANGFLYSFGDSSINVLSNLQSSGSPIVTTLNNQNVDPQVGTTWPGSVHNFGSRLIFANPSGVYALFGGAAEKVGGALDGLFSDADFVNLIPTGGTVTIFGIRVYVILIRTTDYLGVVRNVLCLWDGKKWFLGSQTLTLIYIETMEVNSVITLWGTDGTRLFQMFQTASNALTKVIQTKLWQGDSYVIVKQALRNFCLGTDLSGSGYSLTGTIDSVSDVRGSIGVPTTLVSPPQMVTWVNNSNQAVQFRNNALQNVNFIGSSVLQLLGDNPAASGSLLGETLTSTSSNFTLAALTLQYKRQAPVGG